MCFLAGVNAPNHWLLASNSDNPYTTVNHLLADHGGPRSYLAVRVLVPDDGADVPWAGMLTRGVNDAGLGFTYAFVLEQGMADYPAQAWTARMLANASTVDEALTYFSAGSTLPGNYLVADRPGGMAVVEVGAHGIEVRAPEGSGAPRSNVWQFLPGGIEPEWDAETVSTHRYARGVALLGELGEATPEALQTVLRDHQEDGGTVGQHGRSLCNHGTTNGTISCEIIDPTGHLWFGFGPPCGTRQGHEQDSRTAWGRLVRFSLRPGSGSGDLTTPAGEITPLGARLMS
jgi:hypothetical protein